MAKPVTAIIVGAGSRGFTYAGYAISNPAKFKIIGVAEKREFYRNKLQNEHQIQSELAFDDWSKAAAIDKCADCALITTQDQLHKEPAIAFAKKGYHILLEKPMAVSYTDCCEIVEACKSAGVLLAVCHVLRYTPQAQKIAQLIESGAIGEVVNIQLMEPVGYWHFAHSYVRGNWRNTASSTFSLLAKSCHDFDLIQMWMGKKKCVSISSFGSLKHFTKDNKPQGSASRCVDCSVESSCPYSAKRIYLGALSMGFTAFPVDVITTVPDIEHVLEAIRTGPYGRCVYDCDNDVVDNQVVSMQYEGGATVSFSMVAFTEKLCVRQNRIFGTKGEITCSFDKDCIKQFDFLQNKTIVHKLSDDPTPVEPKLGHGDADLATITAFVDAVATGNVRQILTGPDESLYSHFLCFMGEKARLENRVIDLKTEQSPGTSVDETVRV